MYKFVVAFLFMFFGSYAQGTSLVSFGDSFSDNGASDDYGFMRYSDGNVWVENLAGKMNGKLIDYAYGGALTGTNNVNGVDWSGVIWQANQYKSSDDPIATILAGGNNIYTGKGNVIKAVAELEQVIDILYNKGVEKFILVNLPEFDMAPAYNKEFKSAKKSVKKLVQDFNNEHTRLNLLSTKYKNISICYVDISTSFRDFIDSYGIVNYKDPIKNTYKNPVTAKYLWWDEWHPGFEYHKYLANKVWETCKTN